jgi:hypothetical protein
MEVLVHRFFMRGKPPQTPSKKEGEEKKMLRKKENLF